MFGNLPVTSYSSLYSYTPRTGDVVRFNNGDYGILTGSYSNGGFTYLLLRWKLLRAVPTLASVGWVPFTRVPLAALL